MQETADRMQPLDTSEFSEKLLQQHRDFSYPAVAQQPFPEGYIPPRTKWLPSSKQARKPPAGFMPSKLEHLLLPHAIEKIKRWIQRAVEDLKRVHVLGRATGRRHNAVEALGQDCFVPEARGVIWDLRRLKKKIS